MENIRCYFSLIEPSLLQQIQGKPSEFIAMVQEQHYISEDAFAQRICDKKHQKSYYRELKFRTLNVLQDLLLLSTQRGMNLIEKKFKKCQKKFLAGHILLNNGGRKEGVRLIKQAYDIAVEYDFTHLACELSSILFHHYTYHNKNSQKAAHFERETNQFLREYTVEKKTEQHFNKVISAAHQSQKKIDVEKAIEKINQLNGKSIKHKVHKYTLIVMHRFNTGDYIQVIATCRAAYSEFRNIPGVYAAHNQFFLAKKGIAHIALSQHKEANKCFKEAAPYAKKKSFNDYLLRFYQIINYLHAGDYQEAYTLFQRSKTCKHELLQPQFLIIEAYLHFLKHCGYLQLDHIFRLGKYLNETFKAQTDKRGDNVNILIAELLILLTRDRGRFIDRIESIQRYCYTYLQGQDTRRARWFIKLLCKLPRANFNATDIQRIARKEISNLAQFPICSGSNFAVEIIPFGQLLPMVMAQLKAYRA
ncbi:MAG: hypothetical protein AAGG75_27425 [Bacteroidota bacterium]